jgi:hypothetical protein
MLGSATAGNIVMMHVADRRREVELYDNLLKRRELLIHRLAAKAAGGIRGRPCTPVEPVWRASWGFAFPVKVVTLMAGMIVRIGVRCRDVGNERLEGVYEADQREL